MRTLVINKVKVGSFARVVGVVNAVLGFVSGLLLSFAVASQSITGGTHFVQALGVSVFTLGMSVVIFPIVGFFVGWVHGAIVALVLNFVFKESHGLELEVD